MTRSVSIRQASRRAQRIALGGATIERRRTPRRDLHPSQVVELRALDSEGTWRCRAELLNLSEHGLACRACDEDVSNLRRDARVRVLFQVRPAERMFDAQACVINMTRLAAGGRILGLEFIARPHELLDALCAPEPGVRDAK